MNKFEEIIGNSPNKQTSIDLIVRDNIAKINQLETEQCHNLFISIQQKLSDEQTLFSQQFYLLLLTKELLLTKNIIYYHLTAIYILPWMQNLLVFNSGKGLSVRCLLLMKQRNSGYPVNYQGEVRVDCEKVILFNEEILRWFANNMPYLLASRFKLISAFGRIKQKYDLQNIQRYHYFNELDAIKITTTNKQLERQKITELTTYIIDNLDRYLSNQKTTKTKNFLKMLISSSDNYCIGTIFQYLSSVANNQKYNILAVCEVVSMLAMESQIESINLINVKFLPKIIEYLLPVDFTRSKITSFSKINNSKVEEPISEHIWMWYEITKKLQLSTKIYESLFNVKPSLKRKEKSKLNALPKEFYGNYKSIKVNNEIKRKFIVDPERQEFILNMLNQVINCQQKNSNILDQLSVSQSLRTPHINSFSYSLIKSFQNSNQHQIQDHQSKILNGPPHKKFGNKIRSQQQQNEPIKSQQKDYNLNIYYSSGQKKEISLKQQSKFGASFGKQFREEYYHSSKKVEEYQPQLMNNSNKNFSKYDPSISIHSSQFSEISNKKDKKKQNHSNHRTSKLGQDSGSFLYFQKNSNSDLNLSGKNKIIGQSINFNSQNCNLDGSIRFKDSFDKNLKNESELTQYGFQKNAKVPETIKKPKFSFKIADNTHESSIKLQEQSQIKSLKSQNLIRQIRFKKNNSSIKIGRIKSTQNILPSDIFENSSIIIKNSKQPYLESNSSIYSSKIPQNFNQVLKSKKEKASSLSSKLRPFISQQKRQVKIAKLDKLHNLQNELGQLKNETDQYKNQLFHKNTEIKTLLKKKEQIHENYPQTFQKENEIIKVLMKGVDKQQDHLKKNHFKSNVKSLRQSSKIYSNSDLSSYQQTLKIKFDNTEGYQKQFKKNVLNQRCYLFKNDLIEVGFSCKSHYIILYLTFKVYCDTIVISIQENSLNLEDKIIKSFDQMPIGKQMKLKTIVKDVKSEKKFFPGQIYIKIAYENKNKKEQRQFRNSLPLIPYNFCQMLSIDQNQLLYESRQTSATNYKSPLYQSSDQFIEKREKYLKSLFPLGIQKEDNSFIVKCTWRQNLEIIKIKMKERAFFLEGIGHPLTSGKDLIESIINMLIFTE